MPRKKKQPAADANQDLEGKLQDLKAIAAALVRESQQLANVFARDNVKRLISDLNRILNSE